MAETLAKTKAVAHIKFETEDVTEIEVETEGDTGTKVEAEATFLRGRCLG